MFRALENFKLLNSKRIENQPFEAKLIRDESSLSEKDLTFLRGWTLSGFGVAGVFYLLFRNLYESLGLLAITGFLGRFISNNYATVIKGSGELWMIITVWFMVIVVSVGWIYGIYFLTRYSRRLSWNRCVWKSVKEFKTSEERWFWWNFVGSIVLFVLLSLV